MSEESKQAQIKDLLDSCGNDQAKIDKLDCIIKEVKELQSKVRKAESAPARCPFNPSCTGQLESLTPEVQIRELQTYARGILSDHNAARNEIRELEAEIARLKQENTEISESWCEEVEELEEQIAAPYSTGQPAMPPSVITQAQISDRDSIIKELQNEATDYRRTIREQNVVIEGKSNTNMNAPVMLEDLLCKNTNQIRIIHDLRIRVTGLLNGRTTDKTGYEDLFAGFREKVKQLQDENVNLQTKLAGASSEISQLMYRQELSPVKAELDVRYIESLERKIARQVGLGDNLIKENEALVMRIESLEGVIRNALREIKGVFFLTSREFIRRLEEVL